MVRRKLRTLTRGLGFWSGLAGRGERHEGFARILLYHGTLAGAAAGFARQLSFLKRRFEIVPLAELVAGLREGGLTRRVAITFDDGLRNNVTVAYPILQRLRIPAVFFVCPALIERRQWIWTHEARRRLARCSAGVLRELAREHVGAGPAGVDQIIRWMKSVRLPERAAFERRLREATPDFRPSAAEQHAFDLADWDELRRLDPAIVTVGSHTNTHPILPHLGHDECELELGTSRQLIEERLQRPAEFFAYPNGDYSPSVREAAGRHYRAAVSNQPGWVHPGDDHLALRRVAPPSGALRLAAAMHQSFTREEVGPPAAVPRGA
jgi:peptidoglycan/xylan/chitin deacetylase (PgdA/CDA1 family)